VKGNLFKFIKYIKIYSDKNPSSLIVYVLFVIFMNLIIQQSTIPNIISGYIFGLFKGSILTLIGCIISGIISFYISRKFFRKPLLNEIKNNDEVGDDFKEILEIQNKLSTMEWSELIFLSRLGPIFPFHLISYFWGLTDVKNYLFIIFTTLGVLPILIFETYIGTQIINIKNIFKSGNMYIFGLFAIISFVIVFIIKYVFDNIYNKHKIKKEKET